MRKGIIAGNWKMCGTRESATGLLAGIKAGLPASHCDVIVFPPFIWLDMASQLMAEAGVMLGGQNMCEDNEVARTGEISAAMLGEVGCRYVLVGHSERRTLYGETDAQVAAKVVRALDAGLRPVLCVGETLAQHRAGETEEIVGRQLKAVLDAVVTPSVLSEAVLAYEPVWAIGTGQTATPEQAQAVHAYLRAQIRAWKNDIADEMRILYGGSVKPANASALFAQPDIDGGLVGGASLNAESFLEIINAWPHSS